MVNVTIKINIYTNDSTFFRQCFLTCVESNITYSIYSSVRTSNTFVWLRRPNRLAAAVWNDSIRSTISVRSLWPWTEDSATMTTLVNIINITRRLASNSDRRIFPSRLSRTSIDCCWKEGAKRRSTRKLWKRCITTMSCQMIKVIWRGGSAEWDTPIRYWNRLCKNNQKK